MLLLPGMIKKGGHCGWPSLISDLAFLFCSFKYPFFILYSKYFSNNTSWGFYFLVLLEFCRPLKPGWESFFLGFRPFLRFAWKYSLRLCYSLIYAHDPKIRTFHGVPESSHWLFILLLKFVVDLYSVIQFLCHDFHSRFCLLHDPFSCWISPLKFYLAWWGLTSGIISGLFPSAILSLLSCLGLTSILV